MTTATILMFKPSADYTHNRQQKRAELSRHLDEMIEAEKPWPVFIFGMRIALFAFGMSCILAFSMGYVLRGLL